MTHFMEFGIDLGTTNSCVARYEGDTVRIFQNNDLMNVTPSVVRLLKNGRIIVGKRAYNAISDDAANVAAEFKRWMGQKDKKLFPAAGREMSPEELSSEVLKALREDVQRATGQPLRHAVITVPAAFGALQCDATSRAAKLAGIEESALLQEPIAAAMAYGVNPSVRDQRWLVFDLGGGTLDIAVTSTRDGRLAVLEHRGDNLLGGKDIDRLLVETYFLPGISAKHPLPDPEKNGDEFLLLFRRLALKAEEAKIELSSQSNVIVSLFDIGNDLNGDPIELELTLTRTHLEQVFEPMMRRMLQLADEALEGARLQGKDLNRILLVGGPTQMPYLRARLGEHLNAPVDHSLDPMTVVARGAALYAAIVELKEQSKPLTAPDTIVLQLAFEPVSEAIETPIAGKIAANLGGSRLEVRIESRAGYWTSGWTPIENGYFEIKAVLQQGKICPFYLYVRDSTGKTLNVEPNEFTIRHGLELAAPPLPHTISVEVVRPNGRVELDPIFPRNTPLPAEKRVHYRADHTLRPAEQGSAITVKLWEGEELTEPEANEWVGNVQITSSMVRRPIPEDSEIELFIRVDTSRLLTVDIFVPHLNQHFSEGVYLAEQEQPAEADVAAKLTKEIEVFTDRLRILQQNFEEHANPEAMTTVQTIRRELEDLDIDVTTAAQQRQLADPDRARRLLATGRALRDQIAAIERRVGFDWLREKRSVHAQETVRDVQYVVEKYGSALEKHEFEMIRQQLDQAAQRFDDLGVRKCIKDMDGLNWRILTGQDWWWRDIFETMDKTDGVFVNAKEAQHWVSEGERAIREGKGAALREAVRKLWDLQPRSAVTASQERARRSGVRT